jgi:hypothetical protein
LPRRSPRAPGNTLNSTFNYSAAVDTVVAGYTKPTTAPNTVWNINQVGASFTELGNILGGSTITLTENFCAGPAGGVLGANGGAITGCGAAEVGQIKIVQTGPAAYTDTCIFGGSAVTCGGTSAAPSITLAAPVAFVLVQNNVVISNMTATFTYTVTSLTNEFNEVGESPEPSTFVLLGSALAGIAALRFQKRKLV